MDVTAEGMREFNKNIVAEFRANAGKVGGPFEGATLLLLHSTGAKSGQPRLAPLAYLTIDDRTGCTTCAPIPGRTSKSERRSSTSWPTNCRPTTAMRCTRKSRRPHRPSVNIRRRPTALFRFSN